MSRAINTITAATAADGATNLNIDSGTLFVDTTTNKVGIGTTSPAYKLEVNGAFKSSSAGGNLVFNADSGNEWWTGSWNDLVSYQITRRNISSGNGTSYLTISTSGNVGIGTASPEAKLHISGAGTTSGSYTNGDADAQTLYLQDSQGAQGNGGQILFGASQGIFAGIKGFLQSGSGPAGDLILQTRTTTGNVVERLRVDYKGDVGIGTTNPSDILHVSKANGVSIFESPGVSSVGLRLRTNSTDRWQIGCPNASGDLAIYTGAAATERLRIDSSGVVLIGGTAVEPAGGAVNGISLKPSSSATASNGMVEICNANSPALILGSTTGDAVLARFRRAGAHVGNISVSAGVAAFTSVSDYRLKTNLEPLSNGINRIKQLPVYRFNWISYESGNKLDGFLAHEAKSIVPECVIGEKDAIEEDGNPAYQGIDQSKIVPLLTAALKEAIAKIEVLESKVAALEAA